MKTSSTIVGLLVLALVVGGVYWVRMRPPWPAAADQPTAPAGQSPAAATASAATVASDDALPDVTLAAGSVDVGDVRITLSLAPQPPVAFAKFRVRIFAVALASTATAPAAVRAEKRLALEGGRITFEMSMPMGDHRYSLVPGEQGWLEADVVLPLCASGNRRWYATVEGTAAGRPLSARFRFDLAAPEGK